MRPIRVAVLIGALVSTVATVASTGGASTTPHRSGELVPLRGARLGHHTGLRLVVADTSPFVLDVDTGRVTPVRGLSRLHRGVVSVVGLAGRAAVLADGSYPDAKIYAVRGARLLYLGTARNLTPGNDGRAVWLQSGKRTRCTLGKVALDGRLLRAARPFPCFSGSDPPGGSLGLVVRRTRVVDPLTARTVLVTRWGILAVAGEQLVLAGPGRRFTLLDAAARTERRLGWPSTLPGRDDPAVDPRGRLVALAFAVPYWPGGGQALDVWLLDTRAGKLTQLPGMPALVALKRTSMAWTGDGRLVIFGESGGKDVVAVWRRGQQRLAVKTVQIPRRTGGSDSFALLGR